MTMHREDVDEHVEEAVSCPILSRRLQRVVVQIEETVPGDKTREMMYELVDIVLQMGQRVRALETRVVSANVQEQLSMQQAHAPKRKIDYAKDFPNEREHAEERR